MMHRLALIVSLASLAACSPGPAPTPPTPPAPTSHPEPVATLPPGMLVPAPTADRPSGPAVPASLPGPTSGRVKGMMVAAPSCDRIGAPMRASQALVPKGTTLVQEFSTGCGCLKGPAHFTLAYEPKTSPLRVHLCQGPGEDRCEMACRGTLTWEMSAALHDAGATSFQLVD